MNTHEMMKLAKAANICALDGEHSPDADWRNPDFRNNFWGCGFATLDEDGEPVAIYMTDLDEIQEVITFVTENQIPTAMHYGHNDLKMFYGAKFKWDKDFVVRDTSIAYNMLYDEWGHGEGGDNALGLKALAKNILKKPHRDFLECAASGKDSEIFAQYAKDDVLDQLNLWLLAEPKIEKYKLRTAYDLVCESVNSFTDIMIAGMPFDMVAAESLFNKISELKDEVEQDVYSMIGRLNIGSPQQLQQRLFNELGYYAKGLEMTDSGTSFKTDQNNMKLLAEKHPECEMIMAYKTCAKMLGTYIEKFVDMYMEHGFVTDRYELTSKTGRTRAKIIQTIPNKLGGAIKHNKKLASKFDDFKLRNMFAARPGYKLIVSDLSSAEYRAAAVIADDRRMIDMYCTWKCEDCGSKGYESGPLYACPSCGKREKFQQGEDLHTFVMNVANAQGAGINRSKAKNVSFCTIYNGTAGRLAQMLGLSREKCQIILNAVKSKFTGLDEWHKKVHKALKSTGEVRDLFGRRRKINLAERKRGKKDSELWWAEKGALNELINFGPQSSVSIIGQIAVRNLRRRFKEKGWFPHIAEINGFIHDEIVCHVKEEYAEEVQKVIVHEMSHAVTMSVPMLVDSQIVDRWSEAKG